MVLQRVLEPYFSPPGSTVLLLRSRKAAVGAQSQQVRTPSGCWGPAKAPLVLHQPQKTTTAGTRRTQHPDTAPERHGRVLQGAWKTQIFWLPFYHKGIDNALEDNGTARIRTNRSPILPRGWIPVCCKARGSWGRFLEVQPPCQPLQALAIITRHRNPSKP